MARKAMIEKEKRRKKLADRHRAKRTALRKASRDISLSEEERISASIKLQKLPRNSADVRGRNRCQLTGRPRGFLRKFKLSRIAFRELALRGMIPGVTKSSW